MFSSQSARLALLPVLFLASVPAIAQESADREGIQALLSMLPVGRYYGFDPETVRVCKVDIQASLTATETRYRLFSWDYFDETPTWEISGTTYLFELDSAKELTLASGWRNEKQAGAELREVPADAGKRVSVAKVTMTLEPSPEFHPRINVQLEGKKNFFGFGTVRNCVVDLQAWSRSY